MLSMLRRNLNAPTLIAIVALVFAMVGGAVAANSSGGGKAEASADGKRGPRGPKERGAQPDRRVLRAQPVLRARLAPKVIPAQRAPTALARLVRRSTA